MAARARRGRRGDRVAEKTAEARLALLILEGQSPGRVASALQLSVTTVRTQLSAVLKKTGAQRQSDLVRRLAPLMLLDKDFALR